MPSYKVDALFRHPDQGKEDELEEALHSYLYQLGCEGVTGVTVWQVWPNV